MQVYVNVYVYIKGSVQYRLDNHMFYVLTCMQALYSVSFLGWW